ncbi:MAG: hypothetical protein PHN82_01150 [bacterium]|nr:hypothetical protein [bacterium]
MTVRADKLDAEGIFTIDRPRREKFQADQRMPSEEGYPQADEFDRIAHRPVLPRGSGNGSMVCIAAMAIAPATVMDLSPQEAGVFMITGEAAAVPVGQARACIY